MINRLLINHCSIYDLMVIVTIVIVIHYSESLIVANGKPEWLVVLTIDLH